MFPFLDYYQISQLNCKFNRLVAIPQRMILLMKIILTIVEKFFFTLINGTKYSSKICGRQPIKKFHLVHTWILGLKSKCMSLNVWIELPIYEKNACFSCSVSNPDLFWNCSSSMSARTLVPSSQKNIFRYIYSAWTKIKVTNELFQTMYWILWYK